MSSTLQVAVDLGFPEEIVRGVAVEPGSGTVIVTIEDSGGEPLQVEVDATTGEVI